MRHSLSAVTLRNFRSYTESSFEFDEGVNIIIGPNAVGKTNLLEAVHVACFSKGFRTNSDSELIRNGEEWARIDASFSGIDRIVKLEKSGSSRLKKTFEIGGRVAPRLRFEDLIPIVLFQPDDLRLASGGPERRRNYLDTILSQLLPSYRSDLSAYDRVLKQRNALLKTSNTSPQLFAWNVQLAERGGRIAKRRSELADRLQEHLSEIYSLVAGSKNRLDIAYESALPAANYAGALLKGLESRAQIDSTKGYTTIGPHRDDVSLMLNGRPVKEVASRGESRTLLLALKIIELQEIENYHGAMPLLLLDDVFSELDGSRRKLLTEYLKGVQSIITTTDADVVGKQFTRSAQMITL